jgi:hypothetical protein
MTNYIERFEKGIKALMILPQLVRPKFQIKNSEQDPTIERYRQVMGGGDNVISAYLTLKEIQPLVAKVAAVYYELQAEIDEAIGKQDFLEASNIRDEQRSLKDGLLKLVASAEKRKAK